jgi:16S rRNA processing protein RimM
MATDSLPGVPSDEPDTLEVGRVSKAHGILGELRVTPHWESSDSLEHAERVFLGVNGRNVAYEVERARAVPRAFLIKLRGVDDRNAAEKLHGATVSVARDALGPLEPGEYYLVDLVGAQVFGPEGALGEVSAVTSHPTVDVIVIRLPDGRLVEQALSEPWLASVDVAARRIELSSLDGLM